jgi:hypothetical protein
MAIKKVMWIASLSFVAHLMDERILADVDGLPDQLWLLL